MEITVCVEHLYKGRDLYESLRELGEEGFRNIEFMFWMNKDFARLRDLKEEYGFRYFGVCPDPAATMSDPSSRMECMRILREGIEGAKKIGCEYLAISSGNRAKGIPETEQFENMIGILRDIAAIAEAEGMTLLLEPKNYYQSPDLFLGSSGMAAEMIRTVDSPNLRMLYDIWHMQLQEGNITKRIMENLDIIVHIHAAGTPERHELYTGELNFGYIVEHLKKVGYRGLIGMEYFPEGDPLTGLKRTLELYELDSGRQGEMF